MSGMLKITPKSTLPFIIGFCFVTFVLWSVAFHSLVTGAFFENPSPIFMLVGFLTAFFAWMFYRNGQAYTILDPNGDGKAETEQGKASGVKVFSCHGLRDVTEIHVYRQLVSSTASYYPCLLFKDGFELWLPEGEHIAELAVQWFKENFDMELEVITHTYGLCKDVRQREMPGRCHIKNDVGYEIMHDKP